MTYLITFSTYGSHLHGDRRGSIDRDHNTPGSRPRPAEPELETYEREHMKYPAYRLDATRREIVLDGIATACRQRGWALYAAQVRETHVHVIVEAPCPPNAILQALKAYASKHLNEAKIDPMDCKRWTRHGSSRRIYDRADRERATHYVVVNQGEPMAVFVGEERAPSCRASNT